MSNDFTPQDGMNPELEGVEETVDETTETQAQEEYEETVPKSQFAQVLARAKAAEEENKRLKNQPKQNTTNGNATSLEQIQEEILKAQGVDKDLLSQMKDLAKLRGTSILDVQSDPIVLALKEAKEKEILAQKARLPASRGSSIVKKEVDMATPGLTPEQHKEIWRNRK